MKRTLAILVTAAACILNASAQPHTDQHTRQHFGVHFGISDRPHDDHLRPHDDRHRPRRSHEVYSDVHYYRPVGGRTLLDCVHLKNGSELVGLMTEMTPGESLRLLTYDGSTHVYDLDEVTAVTKRYGRWSNIYRKQFRNYGDFNNPKGYFGIAEFGASAMFYSENIRPSLTIINGYRFRPQFAVGLGVGLNYYEGDGDLTIPVFLHLRSDFFDGAKSPFLALNIGGQITLARGGYFIHEGVVVEPSFGYGFNVGKNQRLNVSLGLAIESGEEKSYSHSYEQNYDTAVDTGLTLRVGYSF